jgi:hypothetical protein
VGGCPEESLPNGTKVVELPLVMGLLGGRVDGGRSVDGSQYPSLISSEVVRGLSLSA